MYKFLFLFFEINLNFQKIIILLFSKWIFVDLHKNGSILNVYNKLNGKGLYVNTLYMIAYDIEHNLFDFYF